MNKLTKYDYLIYYKSCKNNIMKIINKMFKMLNMYSQFIIAENNERMIMMLTRKYVLLIINERSKQSEDITSTKFYEKNNSMKKYLNFK